MRWEDLWGPHRAGSEGSGFVLVSPVPLTAAPDWDTKRLARTRALTPAGVRPGRSLPLSRSQSLHLENGFRNASPRAARRGEAAYGGSLPALGDSVVDGNCHACTDSPSHLPLSLCPAHTFLRDPRPPHTQRTLLTPTPWPPPSLPGGGRRVLRHCSGLLPAHPTCQGAATRLPLYK